MNQSRANSALSDGSDLDLDVGESSDSDDYTLTLDEFKGWKLLEVMALSPMMIPSFRLQPWISMPQPNGLQILMVLFLKNNCNAHVSYIFHLQFYMFCTHR